MSNTILIPTPLRPYVDKQESVEISGTTVVEALANLTTRYNDLRKHLYTDEGRLRSFVNVCSACRSTASRVSQLPRACGWDSSIGDGGSDQLGSHGPTYLGVAAKTAKSLGVEQFGPPGGAGSARSA